ncbi:unnamed protein product, partial [Prunus brigantina]
MKDLDLLHRQNIAPKPILEMSLGLARDVLNLHDRYKEAKATADKLEKQIEELQKQLADCREVQSRLGGGLSSKTKGTFLMQS